MAIAICWCMAGRLITQIGDLKSDTGKHNRPVLKDALPLGHCVSWHIKLFIKLPKYKGRCIRFLLPINEFDFYLRELDRLNKL